QSAATCFCTSMGTGPQAQAGFDLALTELLGPDHHQILIEVGSEVGAEVLAELEHFEASDDVEREAEAAVGRARSQIQRRMDTTGIRRPPFHKIYTPPTEAVG